MNKNISGDIAFFNLLRGLIAPTLKNESLEYKISIDDLANKMEMDQKIISRFLSKLQKEGLIEILNNTNNVNGEVSLYFESTHDKLLEIISLEGIEEKILHLTDFIEKKISYFGIHTYLEFFPKYAKEAKKLIDIQGETADLSELITRGIQDILSYDKNVNRIDKIIFEIAIDADENDLKRLEEIIYYKLNLPVEENPFYVTLFLTALSYQILYL